jgi:hypothetical protein
MKRTKLIITESQYNRLILEQSYSLGENDVLILNLEPKKDKDDDDMPTDIVFGVIDAIGDDIIMINCNERGFDNLKNDIYATNLSKNYNKSSGQLVTYKVNKKNIESFEDFKEELKLKGKVHTFGKTRKVVDIKTEKNKANSLGCNLIKFVKPDEKIKNLGTGWMQITFDDGSIMNINVFEKQGTKLLFDFELDDNNEIVKMKGAAEEFVSKLRNDEFKFLRYGIIDIKDLSKLNENENEPIINLIYQKGDKELSLEKSLTGVKSINVLSEPPKKVDTRKDDDSKLNDKKDGDISPEEYKKILKNSPLLMKALLQRPGLVGSFFNMPQTGLVATEELLGDFSKYIKKNKKKVNFFKFKSDSIITYRVSPSGGDLKGLVAKSKFKDKGNVYIYTNADKTIPTEKDYKYKLKLLKDFNKDTNDNRYGVEYTKVTKDGEKETKEQGEQEIIVTSYGEKKEKK